MRRHVSTGLLLFTAMVVGMLTLAPAAPAAVLLASPTSVDTTGPCIITACRLDRALAQAAPGDEVALEDGVPYAIGYQAQATAPITIRPAVPGTQPRLVGAPNLAFPTLELSRGGTVKGLRIESSSAITLSLSGGSRGIGLEVFADATNSNAVAVKLASAPGTTALLNSVAKTDSANTAVDVVEGTTPGGVSMVNISAIATGGNSWGVTTDLLGESPVLKNSIVRATAKHLHGRSDTRPILVSNSNFGASGAANWTDAGGNQTDVEVTWTDEAAGTYRPVAGSPTIDAGAADALTTGTSDPGGRARSLGAAPDIGAYEYDPGTGGSGGAITTATTTTTTTTTPTDAGMAATTTDAGPSTPPADPTTGAGDGATAPVLPPAGEPVLGQSVTVGTANGTPLVRLPGAQRFVALTDAASIPVGSTVDVTDSRITLTSVRDVQGRTQTGEFWGGTFVVRQAKARTPYTDLVLTGASFKGCPKPSPRARTATAVAAARSRNRRAVIRSLWGKDDKGHFRTRGRNSVATVRGTVWLVQDRCDGTLTRVRQGAVDVRENTGRTVRVGAGRRHLARRR